MKQLLPHFIQERWKEQKYHGKMQGYVMFVDLSGFTAMTEVLMLKGNDGAEELSLLLNEIFQPLVKLVYQENGFIPYFAGDAFMAIFPTSQSMINADTFIRLGVEARDFFKKAHFSGQFHIQAKIGLSFGDVEWGIVGGSSKSYYFRGFAIDSAAICQSKAAAQEIIIDVPLHDKVRAQSNGFWKLAPIVGSWYVVENDSSHYQKSPFPIAVIAPDRAVAQYFLPDNIIDFNQSGEFRNIITLFISFDGVKTHKTLDAFAATVLEQVANFSGYFKEIDYSDKGGVMVVFFGAPIAYENNTQRAVEFALNVRQAAQNFSAVRFRIGMTSGTAYTGLIGGEECCQYAAVGNRVNLAARLMANAKWGEICTDQELSRNRAFRFSYEGNIAYKGIAKDTATYQLLGRKNEEEVSYNGTMIGRDEEFARLVIASNPIFEQQFAGVTYLYGEAGIGKSRLAFELKKYVENKGVSDWLICQADQILKKPFNPFIYCLKNYFQQSIDKSLKDNKLSFDENFESLLKDCLTSANSKSDAVIKELLRTKSILSGLLGIFDSESLWEQLDAKGRYENTLAALSNFFLAEAMLHPCVIVLEDGHWYDDDSKHFLQSFIKNISDFPVFILVTSRYNDENTKSDLFDTDTYPVQTTHIDLNILQPAALQLMAELRLGGQIDEEFLEFLQRSTNGNPFYSEQILEYFSESGLLEKNEKNVWIVTDKSLKSAGSMNAVLTARVDRLSFLVRETVKAAAVIGREFDLPVLSEVMKNQEDFIARNGNSHLLLKEQIQTAERSQIWHAMNELRYIFRHSLLREAIYDMQMRVRLRELHASIAESIEKLYAQNLDERFVDLAFHYEQAENTVKTIEYLNKSAEYAKRNFQNRQAIGFYDKLVLFYPTKEDQAELLKICLKKGELLQLTGAWNEAELDYEKALKLAESLENERNVARAHGLLGNVLMLKGVYPKAKKHLEKGLEIAVAQQDSLGMSRSLGGLGNLYFRQGEYTQAESYFNQCLAEVRKVDERYINPQIVANLGLTYMNQSRYEEGVKCMLDQLRICEANNDRQGMAAMHTNLGIVFSEQGNLNAAQYHYENGLQFSEEMGNKLLISIALGSLGNVFEKKGDFVKAQDLYEKDLLLTEQLGDKQGIAIALGLMGGLYTEKGEFDKALDFLQRNLSLCEELGYQKGIIKALNTLGDLYAGSKHLDLAINYYERAIQIAKKINNKLLHGLSALDLANVYLKNNQLEKTLVLQAEVSYFLAEINNSQLHFEHTLLSIACLRAQGSNDEAETLIQASLLKENITEEQSAALFFDLNILYPKNDELREKVTTLYMDLYRKTPKHVFLQQLNRLQK